MGGKRPDQYNIDPAEAGATDYKNLPQTGQGTSSLDDTVTLDRQQLGQARAEASGIPFKPDVPAPSRDSRRGTKVDDEAEEDGADAGSGKENPLA